MKRLGCLASVLLGLMLFPGGAHAAPITGTSAGAFCAAFNCNSPVGFLESTGDFDPAGVDTLNTSIVYAGTGANAGIFAYIYQINHALTSSEAAVTGIAVPYSSRTTAAIGAFPAIDFWFCADCEGNAPDPDVVDIANSALFTFTDNPILPGQNNKLHGFFSTDRWATQPCTHLDSGDQAAPDCLVPSQAVPEPGALLLFGTALAGFAGNLRRRMK